MGLAILIFYIPSLWFLCWLSGVIIRHLFPKHVHYDALKNLNNILALIVGAATACALVLVYALTQPTPKGNGWDNFFSLVLVSLIMPILLGLMLRFISKFYKQGEEVFLDFFAAGCMQGVWLLPIGFFSYSTSGLFTSGMIVAFVSPVVVAILTFVYFGKLALGPLIRRFKIPGAYSWSTQINSGNSQQKAHAGGSEALRHNLPKLKHPQRNKSDINQ